MRRSLLRVVAAALLGVASASVAEVGAAPGVVAANPLPPAPALSSAAEPLAVDGVAVGYVPPEWLHVGTFTESVDLTSAPGDPVPATITTAKFSTRNAGTEEFVPTMDPFATVSVIRPSASVPASVAGAAVTAEVARYIGDHPDAVGAAGAVIQAATDDEWTTVYVSRGGLILQINGIHVPVDQLVNVASSLVVTGQALAFGSYAYVSGVADDAVIEANPPKPVTWNGSGTPPSYNGNCRDYPQPCARQPWDWRYGEAIGYCNSRSSFRRGGYVISPQAIAWVNGDLGSPSDIDGVHGSKTDAAMATWQMRHGLSSDGCFGWNSWTTAQYGTHRVNNPDGGGTTSYPHMVLTGHVSGRATYRFEEYSTNRGVLYFIDEYYDASERRYWHDGYNCVYVRHPGNALEYTVIEYVFVDECVQTTGGG